MFTMFYNRKRPTICMMNYTRKRPAVSMIHTRKEIAALTSCSDISCLTNSFGERPVCMFIGLYETYERDL